MFQERKLWLFYLHAVRYLVHVPLLFYRTKLGYFFLYLTKGALVFRLEVSYDLLVDYLSQKWDLVGHSRFVKGVLRLRSYMYRCISLIWKESLFCQKHCNMDKTLLLPFLLSMDIPSSKQNLIVTKSIPFTSGSWMKQNYLKSFL